MSNKKHSIKINVWSNVFRDRNAFLHVFHFTFIFWSYFEAFLFDRSRIVHIEISFSWCRCIKIEIYICLKINENTWKIERRQILLRRRIYVFFSNFFFSVSLNFLFNVFNRFFSFFYIFLTTRAAARLILLSTIICFLTTTLVFRVCIAFFLIKIFFVFCSFFNRWNSIMV